VEAEFTF
jgi:hypothetical protein